MAVSIVVCTLMRSQRNWRGFSGTEKRQAHNAEYLHIKADVQIGFYCSTLLDKRHYITYITMPYKVKSLFSHTADN